MDKSNGFSIVGLDWSNSPLWLERVHWSSEEAEQNEDFVNKEEETWRVCRQFIASYQTLENSFV